VANGAVLGLDMSEGMIAYAQKTYQPYYANLSFAKGDILTYTNSSKFDLIISANSLHWVVDHQALLAQVYNLLKDQGSIYFTIPCKPFPEVSRIFNDSTGQEPWKTYLKDYNSPRRKFTPEEYTALLQEAGFNQIEVFQVPLTYRFETKRDLADWYAAFSPMLFYIPEEQHEAFLKSIVDRYLETFPLDEDGRILFKQNELIIKAKK
jgi:trans-aconitate 2-methyltransferase